MSPGNGELKRRRSDEALGEGRRIWPSDSFAPDFRKLVGALRARSLYIRRRWVLACAALLLLWAVASTKRHAQHGIKQPPTDATLVSSSSDGPWIPPRRPPIPLPDTRKFQWGSLTLHHPLPSKDITPLPTPSPYLIPQIQHPFPATPEDPKARALRLDRLSNIKANFTHAWTSYRELSWGADELGPLSGGGNNPFGGWAVTAVEALDTLWLMGMRDEFEATVQALSGLAFGEPMGGYHDFSERVDEIDVFEIATRVLGGLIGGFEVSGMRYEVLLRKAIELGDLLLVAFDTPSHLPAARWKFREAKAGRAQTDGYASLAEMGGMMLEFTRLSQLTGDERYFSAIAHVMRELEKEQDRSVLPGLWHSVGGKREDGDGEEQYFNIGDKIGATYDALAKAYLLLGGGANTIRYRDMYITSLGSMKAHLFFRPMTQDGIDILLPGKAITHGTATLQTLNKDPGVQRSSCFAGGMVALAAKTFALDHDVDAARRLVSGCLWAHGNSPGGILPATLSVMPCPHTSGGDCVWNETLWHDEVRRIDADEAEQIAAKLARLRLMPPFTAYEDVSYDLGPEMVSAIFTLYRVTGDELLREWAWRIFEGIVRYSTTEYGHAVLEDVTGVHPGLSKVDRMESWWLGGTLKLFWLLFEEPGVVSLDEWVINTSGHAMRWRERGGYPRPR